MNYAIDEEKTMSKHMNAAEMKLWEERNRIEEAHYAQRVEEMDVAQQAEVRSIRLRCLEMVKGSLLLARQEEAMDAGKLRRMVDELEAIVWGE